METRRLETGILIVTIAAAITAITTGEGASPFPFMRSFSDRAMGWSNAAAAGLMLFRVFVLG